MEDFDSGSEYEGVSRTKSQARKSQHTHQTKKGTRKAARGLSRLNLADSDDGGDEDINMADENTGGPPASQQRLERSPPSASTFRAQPVPQVDIDTNSLPVGVSVFCNRHLFTRELVFCLQRLDSLKTIKTIVNTYFAYEFKRIGLPREVYSAGIHCVYHRSSNAGDVTTYGAFMTEHEYQLARAEILDGKTTTGQVLRLQILLYTKAQLAADQDSLKDWLADGEYDAMRDIDGLQWLLDPPDTNDPYNDPYNGPRIFEVDRASSKVVTIPDHLYRENIEKAKRREKYAENYTKVIAAKGSIRNQEYDLRKDRLSKNTGCVVCCESLE